jgi:tRNA (cytidine/uridine-2'-O-)-methyltransferase
MPSIALYQPEIPPNTGNIIRLCANTGVALHLIHPLGFSFDDKQLKRAGLDYHEWAQVHHHQDFPSFLSQVKPKQRILACSTRGRQSHTAITYTAGDILLLGPETQGLPQTVLEQLPLGNIIRIPMLSSSRSLNLGNAAAIIIYEALRQIGFASLGLR